jgi:hypothetical protein
LLSPGDAWIVSSQVHPGLKLSGAEIPQRSALQFSDGLICPDLFDYSHLIVIHFDMKNKEVWLFLFFLGTLLLNWPFLDIFSLTLPAYLFGTWGLFIFIVSIFITKLNRGENSNDV